MTSSMISGIAVMVVSGTAAHAADPSSESSVAEVVVTGTRIPSANLSSISPVNTVSSTELKLQGTTNIIDMIDNLPQVLPDFGNYESNGASGTATINLRGLGNKRTMVLVNGVRLQPGDPVGGTFSSVAPDIDMIPTGLVDRVEVLTGGASAVYGSDAVAGVVNFIMKKNFQGLQLDGEVSGAQDSNTVSKQIRTANANGGNSVTSFPGSTWDGRTVNFLITGGANSPDDKGNVEFYMGYTNIQPVLQDARSYTKCSLATSTSSPTFQTCGGSSTSAEGRLHPTSGPNAGNDYNILGTPVDGVLPGKGPPFNFAPYNYLQRPDTRYTAGEFSTYEVNKYMNLYSSFMFMDDHTVTAEAPSGSFYGDSIFNIPCNDPLLSAAQANTLCGPAAGTDTVETAEIGRRNVEGGPRYGDIEHTDFRVQFGSRGDLGDGWQYDVMGLYGRSLLTEAQGGYLINSHIGNSLDVVTDPRPGLPTTGKPVCESVVDGSDTSCVPWNIWTPGGVTGAALQYLTGLALNSGSTTEQIASLNFDNGDLSIYGLKSPMATKGVGFSGGLEYRSESLETQYDALIQNAELAGFGGSLKNTAGSQIDTDVYVEFRAPLIQDKDFFEDLTAEAGYRYADYSHGGGNSTFKFGLDWQMDPSIRLRGSFERAVRAPNVQELFEPATPGLFAGSDPCAGAHPSDTAAQCANTFQHTLPGITGDQLANGGYVLDGQTLGPLYGAAAGSGGISSCPAAQCGDYAGGNPLLKPESADTFSVGAVFTPQFFKGFNFTVDYWNVDITNAIVNIPAEVLVTNCATLANTFDCAQINRFGAGGYTIFGGEGLGSVTQPLINASALKTDGIDINSNYHVDLDDWHMTGYGSLSFSFTGTYVFHLTTVLPDHTQYECIGLYGLTCQVPSPHWRHSFRLSWNTPWNVVLSANWRFIEGTGLDFNTSQPDLQDGAFKDPFPTDAHIPNYSYLDLSFTWRLKKHLAFRGGINNVLDYTPPLLDTNSFGISAPPFGNGNTYPQVYDPLGRTFFFGVTADF
jgi:outer membrane receptor protein involved in Fe transport